ncbi:hypothetical protein [Brucepastera parasyntrophica]|uniref:hypothetical protein n=1 Tax=Brucepastera parasyntrophica TaxID=2880008 RepID=UPI003F719806
MFPESYIFSGKTIVLFPLSGEKRPRKDVRQTERIRFRRAAIDKERHNLTIPCR